MNAETIIIEKELKDKYGQIRYPDYSAKELGL